MDWRFESWRDFLDKEGPGKMGYECNCPIGGTSQVQRGIPLATPRHPDKTECWNPFPTLPNFCRNHEAILPLLCRGWCNIFKRFSPGSRHLWNGQRWYKSWEPGLPHFLSSPSEQQEGRTDGLTNRLETNWYARYSWGSLYIRVSQRQFSAVDIKRCQFWFKYCITSKDLSASKAGLMPPRE